MGIDRAVSKRGHSGQPALAQLALDRLADPIASPPGIPVRKQLPDRDTDRIGGRATRGAREKSAAVSSPVVVSVEVARPYPPVGRATAPRARRLRTSSCVEDLPPECPPGCPSCTRDGLNVVAADTTTGRPDATRPCFWLYCSLEVIASHVPQVVQAEVRGQHASGLLQERPLRAKISEVIHSRKSLQVLSQHNSGPGSRKPMNVLNRPPAIPREPPGRIGDLDRGSPSSRSARHTSPPTRPSSRQEDRQRDFLIKPRSGSPIAFHARQAGLSVRVRGRSRGLCGSVVP